MISNGATGNTCPWRKGAHLAGGILLTAAVIGVGAPHTDSPAPVVLRTTAADLLSASASLPPVAVDLLNGAVTKFTDATQVLSQIDTSGYPDFASFIGNQIATQGTTASFLGTLLQAEDTISSQAGQTGFLGDSLFTLFNLFWYLDGNTALSLANVVENAISNNLPGVAALADMGLFATDVGIFGKGILAFIINFDSLRYPAAPPDGTGTAPALPAAADEPTAALPAAADEPTAALPAAADEPTAALPAAADEPTAALPAAALPAAALPGLPTIAPQIGDPWLELVQKIDGYAFTQDALGLYHNNDILGTIAMQINFGLNSSTVLSSLGINTIASQVLAGDWASPLPVTTDFFEEFVTKEVNADAFVNGLPANPGDPIETIAYQLDNLLENSVYAIDLNAAALILWP